MHDVSIKEFSLNYASEQHISISDEVTYPRELESIVDYVIKEIENADKCCDWVDAKLSHIQTTIESTTDLEETMKKSVTNGIIPDGLLNSLSCSGFGVYFNDLDETYQAIIKTLAIFTCIESVNKITESNNNNTTGGIKMNKGKVEPISAVIYDVTESMVVGHLENLLKFRVIADFKRWIGPEGPAYGMVTMRTAYKPTDFVVKHANGDYIDSFLASAGPSNEMNPRVYNVLKPFMYPENIQELKYNVSQKTVDRLRKYGLTNERVDELIAGATPSYSKECDAYGIYLRPERIIYDILCEEGHDVIDGEFAIISVTGGLRSPDSDVVPPIVWRVAITPTNATQFNSDINLDRIFGR